MVLKISQLSQLKNKAKNDLNTLVGVNQMQYLKGFESAIDNVYLEANRYRDIDGYISDECCNKLLAFIDYLELVLGEYEDLHFIKGQIAAYVLCKKEIEKSIAQVVK